MATVIDPIMSRFRTALDRAYGPRLERVVLFGSRARGDARPDADYDVALFLKDPESFGREADRIAEIETEILYETGAVISAPALQGRRLSRAHGAYGRASPRRRRPVRPEAADYLNKAHDDLEDARKVARIGLAKIAARTAYYAAFHAAEAFFVERTGKIAKTHSGVRAAFARLAKETIDIDMYFPKFLTKAHLYKEISDYGTRSGPEITVQDEEEAITDAGRFVDCIGLLLKPNR